MESLAFVSSGKDVKESISVKYAKASQGAQTLKNIQKDILKLAESLMQEKSVDFKRTVPIITSGSILMRKRKF